MGTRIREVHFGRSARLAAYKAFDTRTAGTEDLRRLGREVARKFGPHRLWMLNSTASGGGVAEMMPRLCALLDDVGLDVRWLVLETDDERFFRVTKALHNLMHGEQATLPPDAASIYEEVSREAASHLRHLASSDVLVVHDPQPAGVAAHLPRKRSPSLVWRSHVGVERPNEDSHRAWRFLAPHLACYDRLVFSSESYVPTSELGRASIIAPGIDPLSHKNRSLRPYKLVGILRAAGLLEGPKQAPWACFDTQAERWTGGRWQVAPVPELLFRPFVLQVSRFDRLKGFSELLRGFARFRALWPAHVEARRLDTRRVRCELQAAQLLLVGPDPSGVADDPEASEVANDLCREVDALPDDVRASVHVIRLPMWNTKENALMVNALQRSASICVQNSIREGFGLTAAEALWKEAPTVVSNVGGLALQVRHDVDGQIVHDPRAPEEMALALLELLGHPHRAEHMGQSGHARVKEHFLVLTQMRRWLEVLGDVLDARSSAASL